MLCLYPRDSMNKQLVIDDDNEEAEDEEDDTTDPNSIYHDL